MFRALRASSEQSPSRRSWIPAPSWLLLLALLLTLLAAAGFFGARIHEQASLIDEVSRIGGAVELKPRGPKWAHSLFGERWTSGTGDVIYIDLRAADSGSRKSLRDYPVDSLLARMGSFSRMRKLDLRWTKASDEGLLSLCRLAALEEVRLDGTLVTDEGLQHLPRIKSLQRVGLSSTRVTDAGLAHLGRVEGLERLWLNRTSITGLGIPYLRASKGLWDLEFSGTRVSDATVRELKGFPALSAVSLRRTQVTGQCVEELSAALPGCHFFVVGD